MLRARVIEEGEIQGWVEIWCLIPAFLHPHNFISTADTHKTFSEKHI